jgi:hypothetical protein
MSDKKDQIKGLPQQAYRFDEQGKPFIHIDYFERHPQNPRDEKDYSEDGLFAMKRSISSKEHGGIHMPVCVYIKDKKSHTIEGHLRVTACKQLAKEISQDTDLPESERKALIEKFEWIPVSIETFESEIQILIRMQSSDSLKKEWSFEQRLKHIGNIYKELEKEGKVQSPEDLSEDIAASIGWKLEKLRVMVRIRLSDSLYSAVRTYSTCTYKGWLHMVRIGEILMKKRPQLLQQLTKIENTESHEFQEAVYQLLVNKMTYYVQSNDVNREKRKKAQPGSLLERCTPLIRNASFPAARIKAWLTKPIDITPTSVERFTDASERKRKYNDFMLVVKQNEYNARKSEKEILETITKLKSSGSFDDRPKQPVILNAPPIIRDLKEIIKNPATDSSKTEGNGTSGYIPLGSKKPFVPNKVTKVEKTEEGRRKNYNRKIVIPALTVNLSRTGKGYFAALKSHFSMLISMAEKEELFSSNEELLGSLEAKHILEQVKE